MNNEPERYKCLIGKIHFTESCLDKLEAPQLVHAAVWTCEICVAQGCGGPDGPSGPCGTERKVHFLTKKDLQQHKRIVHKERNPMRFWADETGKCLVCATSFCTRPRLIAHLSDSRRPRCRDRIIQEGIPVLLTAEAAEVLDGLDAQALREARKKGHTHIIAVGSARTSSGKRVGHVRH